MHSCAARVRPAAEYSLSRIFFFLSFTLCYVRPRSAGNVRIDRSPAVYRAPVAVCPSTGGCRRSVCIARTTARLSLHTCRRRCRERLQSTEPSGFPLKFAGSDAKPQFRHDKTELRCRQLHRRAFVPRVVRARARAQSTASAVCVRSVVFGPQNRDRHPSRSASRLATVYKAPSAGNLH